MYNVYNVYYTELQVHYILYCVHEISNVFNIKCFIFDSYCIHICLRQYLLTYAIHFVPATYIHIYIRVLANILVLLQHE